MSEGKRIMVVTGCGRIKLGGEGNAVGAGPSEISKNVTGGIKMSR
jgi:hypothetical protein